MMRPHRTEPDYSRDLAEAVDSGSAPPVRRKAEGSATLESVASRPRVLVVDDDLEMREMIADFLRDEGMEVDTAPNVLSAFVALLKRSPKVLIVDWVMPALDGLQLLRNVELLQPDLPVIFISAFVHPEVALLAAERGAFAVLSKPFPLERLLTEVQDALEAEPTRPRRRERSSRRAPSPGADPTRSA